MSTPCSSSRSTLRCAGSTPSSKQVTGADPRWQALRRRPLQASLRHRTLSLYLPRQRTALCSSAAPQPPLRPSLHADFPDCPVFCFVSLLLCILQSVCFCQDSSKGLMLHVTEGSLAAASDLRAHLPFYLLCSGFAGATRPHADPAVSVSPSLRANRGGPGIWAVGRPGSCAPWRQCVLPRAATGPCEGLKLAMPSHCPFSPNQMCKSTIGTPKGVTKLLDPTPSFRKK